MYLDIMRGETHTLVMFYDSAPWYALSSVPNAQATADYIRRLGLWFGRAPVRETTYLVRHRRSVVRYKIIKASRIGGTPYAGGSCQRAGVPRAKLYEDRRAAELDAAKIAAVNPAGFVVKQADGTDALYSDMVRIAGM